MAVGSVKKNAKLPAGAHALRIERARAAQEYFGVFQLTGIHEDDGKGNEHADIVGGDITGFAHAPDRVFALPVTQQQDAIVVVRNGAMGGEGQRALEVDTSRVAFVAIIQYIREQHMRISRIWCDLEHAFGFGSGALEISTHGEKTSKGERGLYIVGVERTGGTKTTLLLGGIDGAEGFRKGNEGRRVVDTLQLDAQRAGRPCMPGEWIGTGRCNCFARAVLCHFGGDSNWLKPFALAVAAPSVMTRALQLPRAGVPVMQRNRETKGTSRREHTWTGERRNLDGFEERDRLAQQFTRLEVVCVIGPGLHLPHPPPLAGYTERPACPEKFGSRVDRKST